MTPIKNDNRAQFGFETQMKNADPGIFRRWYAERLLLNRSHQAPAVDTVQPASADESVFSPLQYAA